MDIYNSNNNGNPFCDIILQIKNEFQENEAQLQRSVATRNNKVDLNNFTFQLEIKITCSCLRVRSFTQLSGNNNTK